MQQYADICATTIKKKEHQKQVKTQDRGKPELLSAFSVPSAPIFISSSVTLPFPCTSREHAMCCICKRPEPKVVAVAVDERHRVFFSKENIMCLRSKVLRTEKRQDFDNSESLSTKKTWTFSGYPKPHFIS